jgi:hypothetical protein
VVDGMRVSNSFAKLLPEACVSAPSIIPKRLPL